jgi:ATP-dependent Clp protease ATP-binding subunit ClpA
MKKEITITKLLGATQLEMSILLGINASQWSMYESDDRDLPNDALSLMNEMLKHVQNKNDKQLKMQELSTQQQDKKRETLDKLLKENDYQQQTIERKIRKIKKKQAFVVARFQLLDFLNNHTNKKEEHPELLQRMKDKAEEKAEQFDESVLIAYELKQTLLKEEEKLLKSYLEKLF